MHLTLHEQERLMIRVTADLVERRLVRDPNLKLNYPEVMALFAAYVLEEARHGGKTVAELMDTKMSDVAQDLQDRLNKLGANVTLPTTRGTPGAPITPGTSGTSASPSLPLPSLPFSAWWNKQNKPTTPGKPTIHVMDGVREMIGDVQIEATFEDGTKLVTIPNPLGTANDDATVYPGKYDFLLPDNDTNRIPYNLDEDDKFPDGVMLWVKNTADRPIQVGSHYHLDDVNKHDADDTGVIRKGLAFYKNEQDDLGNDKASDEKFDVRGYRLHIAAGTSERFEPGDDAERKVWVVPIRGSRHVWGLQAGKTTSQKAKVPQR